MATAREIALKALMEYRRRGAWLDLQLKRELAGASPEEAGLATAIANGVLQKLYLLDFYIESFSRLPGSKIMPQVRDILRMGVYQLLYMDRVPAYAVIDQSVRLAKRHGGAQAGGYVNGLLRSVDRARGALPQPDAGDRLGYLSVAHSHPRWLVERLDGLLGEAGCQALLEANNAPFRASARVNTLKITPEALLARLEGRSIAARPHGFLPDALSFESLAGVSGGPELGEGLLYIMDTASQLCVHALAPAPGSRVIDLCAAPGGKSLMAGQLMAGRGSILALDIHPHKADLLERAAQTYGLEPMMRSAACDSAQRRPELEGSADFAICDVPCSGLGVIRKKPEIRYKDPAELKALPRLQAELLRNAGSWLRPGGALVYSTCTLLPEENDGVVDGFLAENPGFCAQSFELPGLGAVPSGRLTLYPHIHGTDGFFICKLVKAPAGES